MGEMNQPIGIYLHDSALCEADAETKIRERGERLAGQPIAGVNASVTMITKGGLSTVIRSLAIEYAREGIRFNAVAPRRRGYESSSE